LKSYAKNGGKVRKSDRAMPCDVLPLAVLMKRKPSGQFGGKKAKRVKSVSSGGSEDKKWKEQIEQERKQVEADKKKQDKATTEQLALFKKAEEKLAKLEKNQEMFKASMEKKDLKHKAEADAQRELIKLTKAQEAKYRTEANAQREIAKKKEKELERQEQANKDQSEELQYLYNKAQVCCAVCCVLCAVLCDVCVCDCVMCSAVCCAV
jgi:hypothetical protein